MDPLQDNIEPVLAGYRVLVVEDDYFVAQDLCVTLREHGATVFGPAPSIASARNLASTLRPDCVLLDINLDGEHAFELARELQAGGTRTVFTTGYDASFVPMSLRSTLCLQKPIDAGALLRGIRKQLPGKLPE
ncbi:MAG: response regulator [Sinobacteraceae bacterium]|nr:response regulator [Nevskiaceae bacterium]